VTKNLGTDPLSYKNISNTGSGPMKLLAEPSLDKCLRFNCAFFIWLYRSI